MGMVVDVLDSGASEKGRENQSWEKRQEGNRAKERTKQAETDRPG